MRRLAAALALLLALWTPASLAHAGVYTDDLTKCLVKHTGDADRTAFLVWMFSSMSVHPAVQGYSKINDAQREELSKHAAVLLQRLMTEDCRTDTVAALKYEGASAIEASFNVLGQVAMRDLMSDPAVRKGFELLGSQMDIAKFEALGKEAGVSPPLK
jgi:hypothetical protein